jgi:DAK2 domain fusion protein YloV
MAEMKQVDTIGGQDLREMLAAATNWLEKSSADIDALNVFPVPDGDTGTNMLLTMRSSIEEAFRAPDNSACAVAQAVALGALMGARGNSGVILSQIWRGMARGLEEKESCTGDDLAAAMESASEMAYKGLSNPVEGTILTVIKDVSTAAQAQVSDDEKDFVSVMEAMVAAAAKSVANTPNLLSVLKEAGVVDAGGQGLYTILDGALRYLKGEAEQMKYRKPQLVIADVAATKMPQIVAADEEPYGYCTEFLLKGEELAPEKIRTRLKNRGESLIVVGDESAVRIHIHTLDPGNVLRYATALGTVHQVSIRNMDEQHEAYLDMQKERMPLVNVATIAVVSGEGLAEVFKSLGTTAIVAGGQTMNPSTKDLLRVVESVTSDNVIILPNNKNIVATANQVQSVTPKKIVVVPSETIPQGVSALLAFDYEADFETNAKLMARAISTVRSIEITRAVRSAKLGDLTIRRKQAIGFLDGALVNVGTTPADALSKVLAELDLEMAEVITIYFGADTEPAEAQEVSNKICQKHPHLQVEVVRGGQPHYNYIVSVE